MLYITFANNKYTTAQIFLKYPSLILYTTAQILRIYNFIVMEMMKFLVISMNRIDKYNSKKKITRPLAYKSNKRE